jgi:hypothetical protein
MYEYVRESRWGRAKNKLMPKKKNSKKNGILNLLKKSMCMQSHTVSHDHDSTKPDLLNNTQKSQHKNVRLTNAVATVVGW